MEEELSTKKPWMMFAAICAIVMGIVLFCVIMGSYSSLLRAKGRINKGKSLLIAECEKRTGTLEALTAMAGESLEPKLLDTMVENGKKCPAILNRMEETKLPLEPELVLAFHTTQGRLSQDISFLIRKLNQNSVIGESKEFKDLKEAVKTHQDILDLATRRYNKQVRYFNQRKLVFPGFLIANWFHLDQWTFPELDPEIFTAPEADSDQKQ